MYDSLYAVVTGHVKVEMAGGVVVSSVAQPAREAKQLLEEVESVRVSGRAELSGYESGRKTQPGERKMI